jgi:hypothetical protein
MGRAFLFNPNPERKTMAIILEANYSKKIGLPEYSSHQFSITLKTEITDMSKLPEESNRLYTLLQHAVDKSIQTVGYLPEPKPDNRKTNGNGRPAPNGNGQHPRPPEHDWKCTVAQKELIQRVVEENKLDKNVIEDLAQKRFRKGVKLLNKLEASGFITELLDLYPGNNLPRSR